VNNKTNKSVKSLISTFSGKGAYEENLHFRIFRYFGYLIAKPFLNTRITPNQVTLFGLFVGLAGVVLLSLGSYWCSLAAIFVLFFHYALDWTDGCIARFRGLSSMRGEFLDAVNDVSIRGLTFLAIGINLFVVHNNAIFLFLGSLAMFGILMDHFVQIKKAEILLVKGGAKTRKESEQLNITFDTLILKLGKFAISKPRRYYLEIIALGAVLNQLSVVLVFYVFFNLFRLVMITYAASKFKETRN